MSTTEPKVILTIHPHVTVEYNTAEHPGNKCTFPLTAGNVADVTAQLADELKKSQAMEVLASS